MNIAVFHNLPFGGAKRAFYGQVKYLRRVGHELEVYIPSTADENYLPLKDVASGLHVYPMRLTGFGLIASFARYGMPPQFFIADLERTHERIAEAINASPCDLVFSGHDQWTGTPFLARYVKKPMIYYCQEPVRFQERILVELGHYLPPWPACKRVLKTNWKRRLPKIDRENARYVRCILTNSYFSREAILRAFGFNAFVSYLGVDTCLFRPLRLPEEDFILSVGVCDCHKGYDFVLRALSLIDKGTRPRLVIVANHTNRDWEAYLTKAAANLEVELEVKKAVSDEDLVVLYNQAKVFVYGAILEPFGLAPVEAMACGTPVVAVKEGGVRETVVHQATGLLTERDEGAFAEAVAELLRDETLRKRFGDGGVEAVRSFWTWEQAGERLVGHLKRVVEGQGTANSEQRTGDSFQDGLFRVSSG